MHHGWHHWHRPSRLIWFVVGAVSATWFMKHREHAENYRVKYCSRFQIPQEAYPPPASAQAAQMTDGWQWQKQWRERGGPFAWPPQETSQVPPAEPAAQQFPATQRPAEQPPVIDGWEDERQRLMKIKQQATDSLLDFSEDGLNSLLTSMESLKSKLAERRAQREQEAREIAQRESEYRQFEDWRKSQAGQAERSPTPKRLV